MFRILIMEDDPSEADALKTLLSRYSEETGERFDITVQPSALEFLEKRHPYDLYFLDIGLPGINGMEAARLIRDYDEETPLIFVTSLAQYAAGGYEVRALDFMVKPVSYSDFRVRMDRAMRVSAQNASEGIYISTKDGMRAMPARDVLYVDVRGHTVTYHLKDGAVVPVRGTLRDCEKDLEELPFVRISNCCLVNMRHVRSVSGEKVLLSNGEECFLTRSKRHAALQRLADYFGRNV
ncbi:MAG: LytR/AlgR family response regulator transcription factor [Tractidigestivibacter sp.]|uniref:LytR/AlgR family response regulator transcription factor n=1 Tax=Tractidigestivibacter sp. TaxID=2847320 RepID=UPI003D8B227F